MAVICEKNYVSMMEALCRFSKNVEVYSKSMNLLADACVQKLGDKDKASAEIAGRVNKTTDKLAEITEQAKRIARTLQEELDEQKKEEQIWNED